MKLSAKDMKEFINADYSGNEVTHIRLKESQQSVFRIDTIAVIRGRIIMEVSTYCMIDGRFHSGTGSVSMNVAEAIEKYIKEVRGL